MDEAAAKARDAYLLRSTEPESWRAVARVEVRTGQSASALEWWKKVDDANRLTAEDRRDFIAAAVVSGEIAVAAKQVEVLLAQMGAHAYRYRVGGSSRSSTEQSRSGPRLRRTSARR